MKKRVTPFFVCIGQGEPGAGKGEALLGVHKLVPAMANHTTIPADAAALKALQDNTSTTWLVMASRILCSLVVLVMS